MPQLTSVHADDQNPNYEVKACGARFVRRVIGDMTNEVKGVPAEPAYSFNQEGNAVESIDGEASLEVDPVTNSGEIKAEWTDRNGEWTLI